MIVVPVAIRRSRPCRGPSHLYAKEGRSHNFGARTDHERGRRTQNQWPSVGQPGDKW